MCSSDLHGTFNKLGVVLKIGENNFVIAQNRRGAATVLADERAEVTLPNLFAPVVQSGEEVMIGLVPDDIDAVGIDGWRGRSKAVVLMFLEWLKVKIPFPKDFAVLCVNAKHGYAAGPACCASHKKTLTPKHGRGMATAGQRDLPMHIRIADFDRQIRCMPYAGAVWPSEAGPFLRR